MRSDYGTDAIYTEMGEAAIAGWKKWNAEFRTELYHEDGFLVMTTEPMKPGGFESDSFEFQTARGHKLLRKQRDDLKREGGAWTAGDTLKNVIVMLRHPDGRREALAIGVPGDREVDMKRLEALVIPAEVEPFGEGDFAARPALVKGYVGPDVLGASMWSREREEFAFIPGPIWPLSLPTGAPISALSSSAFNCRIRASIFPCSSRAA